MINIESVCVYIYDTHTLLALPVLSLLQFIIILFLSRKIRVLSGLFEVLKAPSLLHVAACYALTHTHISLAITKLRLLPFIMLSFIVYVIYLHIIHGFMYYRTLHYPKTFSTKPALRA